MDSAGLPERCKGWMDGWMDESGLQRAGINHPAWCRRVGRNKTYEKEGIWRRAEVRTKQRGTIRIINSKPCFVKNHFNRLIAGMKQLKMDIPKEFSVEFLEKKLVELVKENNLVGGGVARLSVFRAQGTTYLPLSNAISYIVHLRSFDNNYFELNSEGLNIGIFSEIKKPKDPFSLFKTSNALLYVMAAIHAKENNYDDCFLMNKSNELIETTSSNIFIVSNRILYTPSLENGCVAGTMRMNIINLAIENKIKVYECSITHRNLLLADIPLL